MVNDDRHEVFKRLYQKYYRRVVTYFIRAFSVSDEDARDLAQDTFVRFYEAIQEYRGDAEWAFLERTAQRVGLNRIRAFRTQKRGANLIDIDDPDVREEPVAPSGPDYAERQQLADRIRRLHDAISELSPAQRQCIQLRLDGFKYEEIARSLRMSMDAVRSRLRDATRTLRAKLGDDNGLPEDES